MNTTTQTAPLALTARPLELAARYLGLPALMLGVAASIGLALERGASLPLASLAILLGALVYLFGMERLIPFRESWHPTAREWRRDGIYFGLNGALSTALGAGVVLLAIAFARGTTGLSLAAEIPLGFLLASFLGYWTHRLGHDLRALWPLHGVHHAPDKVNAWNNNVIHFLDLAFQNGSSLAALVLLGFSPEAVFAVTAFSQVVGFGDHVNADFRFGPLNYLIGSPELHRLHHSTEREEAGNYAILPLWDLLFGTFSWRPRRVPAAIGIERPETFPSPLSVWRNALHPFRRWFRRGR